MVLFGESLDLLPGDASLEEAQLGVLGAEDDVVQHGEHVHQLKVLVHHADVQGGGVVGVVDFYFLAVFLDDALFRLIQAEQNAHQRGFTGAVLAQQGVDLALPELERDIVVGDNAGELFSNMEHFDDIIGFHRCPPSRVLHPVIIICPGANCKKRVGKSTTFPAGKGRLLGESPKRLRRRG